MIRRVSPSSRAAVAAAVFALCLAPSALADTGFVFQVPAGWTDLSGVGPATPTTPTMPTSAGEIPTEMMLDARTGKYAALAVDAAHAGDGFGENLKAIVGPGTQAVTEKVVDDAAAAMARAKDTEVREHRVAELAGVAVGRVVVEKRIGGRKTRALVFLLPGKDEHAILTYEATPETFDAYLPVFESAAAATRGLTELAAPRASWGGERAGVFIGVGLSILGAIAIAVGLRRWRRRGSEAAPRRGR